MGEAQMTRIKGPAELGGSNDWFRQIPNEQSNDQAWPEAPV